jgi:dihydroneopterin aldolase
MHHQLLDDFIELSNLELELSVGAYTWEKNIKQKLKLDLIIFQNHRNLSDNLENTVDYAALYHDLKDVLAQRHFELIETIADFIAVWLLEKYPISGADVKIKKFHAVKGVAFVGARALRLRSSSNP